MVVVPDFLIKRIYKKGSLTDNNGHIEFTLKNILGPGFLSGFGYVKINETMYAPSDVKFITQGQEFSGADISEANPISFRLGQEGIVILNGNGGLVNGNNKIEIEVFNPEAGKVYLKVDDNYGN